MSEHIYTRRRDGFLRHDVEACEVCRPVHHPSVGEYLWMVIGIMVLVVFIWRALP